MVDLILDSAFEIPSPPEHLSEETQGLWMRIVSEYQMDEPHTLAVLQAALEAWDQMREAQEIIRAEGLQVKDRFDQNKKNPLLDVVRDCRRQFYDGMRMLNLDIEPLREGPGRPPKNEQLTFDL